MRNKKERRDEAEEQVAKTDPLEDTYRMYDLQTSTWADGALRVVLAREVEVWKLTRVSTEISGHLVWFSHFFTLRIASSECRLLHLDVRLEVRYLHLLLTPKPACSRRM